MSHLCSEAHGDTDMDSGDRSGLEVYVGNCRHVSGSSTK